MSTAKLYLGLIMLALIGATGWMTKLYFEVRAEREQAIQAFATYSNNAQAEAIEQNQKMAKLSIKYQGARDDFNDTMAVFDGHDLKKIITDKPDMFISRHNVATDRLFEDIEAITRRSPRTSEAAGP